MLYYEMSMKTKNNIFDILFQDSQKGCLEYKDRMPICKLNQSADIKSVIDDGAY